MIVRDVESMEPVAGVTVEVVLAQEPLTRTLDELLDDGGVVAGITDDEGFVTSLTGEAGSAGARLVIPVEITRSASFPPQIFAGEQHSSIIFRLTRDDQAEVTVISSLVDSADPGSMRVRLGGELLGFSFEGETFAFSFRSLACRPSASRVGF
jgi:hypothetical protein